jgi:hypothetical protein
MCSTTDLIDKYRHYQMIGHSIFAVTLSTYVKSYRFAASDRMRHFWDHHFIYRVKRSLPFKAKIDHDWVLEQSPDGFYHYHGLLAVESAYRHRIWSDEGLSKKLSRALDTFAERGDYRLFRVNKYLIEPVVKVEAWTTYSTKQNTVRA